MKKKNQIYLNYAGVGILPETVKAVIGEALETIVSRGSTRFLQALEGIDGYRKTVSKFLGCRPAEIAFTGNTSSGLRLVAQGLDFKTGDEVVVFENDFPANVLPWLELKRKGVNVAWVPMKNGGYDLADLGARLNPRTRLVAVSHVNFMTGFRIDLDEVCALARRSGALVCVDAIQGLGAVPLDLARTPVDFLACGGHKWLCGPLGSGLFFCREKNLDLFANASGGWLGYEGSADFLFKGEGHFRYDRELKRGAERFETGVPNVLCQFGIGESVRVLEEIGGEKIASRIRERVRELEEGIRGKGYRILTPAQEHRSGILSFVHPKKDGLEIFKFLTDRDAHVAFPDGKLRVSPHYWTTEDEVREFVGLLPE